MEVFAHCRVVDLVVQFKLLIMSLRSVVITCRFQQECLLLLPEDKVLATHNQELGLKEC